MQVRGEVAGGGDQQSRDHVVHLSRLNRREPEAHLGDGGDQGFEELTETRLTPGASPGINQTRGLGIDPGLAPGVSRAIPTVGPDMHPSEHYLRMVLRQRLRFPDELGDRPRSVRAPRDGGRAEGAVLVAAVLDLEPAAGAGVETT